MFTKNKIRSDNRGKSRKGVAAVEFAVVAPVLLTLVLGLIQWSRAYDVQQELATALRQGARLAGMDKQEVLQPGESTNEKIANDISNFLDACGMQGDRATVSVTHPGTNTPMDLDDPANELKYFELSISIPAIATKSADNFIGGDNYDYKAKIVFRNSRGVLVQ